MSTPGDFANRGMETGPEIFFVDNRGKTLYVQLKPTARELPEGMAVSRGDRVVRDFPRAAAHAQLKNGHHNGQGYFADNQVVPGELPDELPLKQVFDLVLRAFDLAPPPGQRKNTQLTRAKTGSRTTDDQSI